MSLIRTIIALSGFLALFGCTATAPSATTVQLSVAGAGDMNGGAPAKVKVYYLASTGNFRTADFFAVFNSAEATLGADLIAVDEVQLAPGRTVNTTRTFPTPPAAIGVVAAFRNIDGAKFLDVRPFSDNVRVVVSGNSVSIR